MNFRFFLGITLAVAIGVYCGNHANKVKEWLKKSVPIVFALFRVTIIPVVKIILLVIGIALVLLIRDIMPEEHRWLLAIGTGITLSEVFNIKSRVREPITKENWTILPLALAILILSCFIAI